MTRTLLQEANLLAEIKQAAPELNANAVLEALRTEDYSKPMSEAELFEDLGL